MPHQIIEYSANLEKIVEIDSLVEVMHQAALASDELPIAGMRTRAVKRELYRIADSHPDNGFIGVSLRIAPRPAQAKKAIGEHLLETLAEFAAPIMQTRPIALSLEIQEIDIDYRWNQSNIRDFLARRGQ
ncbi:5-carboxymethyl-2-hydroxymuconate Delta-isomerase [Candidatus Foliamicus sp.]